jgi:ADP-ribose pyrophosphatase
MEIPIESKTVLIGRNFRFRQDEVQLPNGRITTRDIVEHPGSVGIIPITGEGEILLVEQYRYAVGRTLMEIPAGTLEESETMEECVYRELKEETGYEASVIEKIVSCYTTPGYSSEKIQIYLAKNLEKGESSPEEDEIIRVVKLNMDKVIEMIGNKEIDDAKTILGLLGYLTKVNPP